MNSLCFIFVLFHWLCANGQFLNNETRKVHFDKNCVHYEREGGHNFHCEEKIHLTFTRITKRVNDLADNRAGMTVKCDSGTQSDPYKYGTLIDLQDYEELYVFIDGCPPPENGYSFIPTRRGGNISFIGQDYRTIHLNLFCRPSGKFHVRSLHFRKFTNLKRLNIECPSLYQLESDLIVTAFKDMSTLEIKNTALESIPNGMLSQCHSLSFLTISNNKLKSIPSLNASKYLSDLDVSENEIEYLNDDVFQYTKEISTLIMSYNRLKRLPDSLLLLDKLVNLQVSDNRLQFVSLRCLGGLTSLKHIDLGGNKLHQLGSQLTLSTALTGKEQDDTPTKDEEASDSVRETTVCSTANRTSEGTAHPSRKIFCSTLRRSDLILRNNSLTSIKENLLFELVDLEALDLSYNMLLQLPPNIFHKNICLRKLHISNNNISNVSETLLANNGGLQQLDLSSNHIRALGVNFFSGLQELTLIDLSNNAIDTLPEGIFLVFNTTTQRVIPLVLNLEGNLLKTLPILTLPRLTELNLARNRLVHLPPTTLEHVHKLQRINLSYNAIQHIKPTPGESFPDIHEGKHELFHDKLKHLRYIDLSYNRLDRFPIVKAVRDNLKSLNLSGNVFLDYLQIFYEDGRVPGQTLAILELLDLSNNTIGKPCPVPVHDSHRSPFSFPRMEALKYLDLSWNQISLSTSYNDSKIKRYHHLPGAKISCDWYLNHMPNLEVLKLSHNEIDVIPKYIRYMTRLRLVDLSHNKIKSLYFHEYFFINALTRSTLDRLGDSEWRYVRRGEYFELPNSHNLTVDLRHNEISAVQLSRRKMQIVPRDNKVDQKFSKATLMLGNNPIVCSCQILPLIQYSQREIRPVSEEEMWEGKKLMLPSAIDIQDLSCWEPQSVRGKNLSEPETWMHHLLPLCILCQAVEHDVS